MDSFCEYLIKRKKAPWEKKITWALIAIGVLFSAISFTLIFPIVYNLSPSFASLIFPLVVLAWFGIYVLVKNFSIEFEYAITAGEIDIDKITNKSKRVRVVSKPLRRFEIIAPVLSDKFSAEYKALKIVDCSANSDENNTYFAVYSDDEGRKCLLFDPTEKMLGMIKEYCPDKYFE